MQKGEPLYEVLPRWWHHEYHDYAYFLEHAVNKQPKVTLYVADQPITAIIDTGASVNVRGKVTFNRLKRKPELVESSTNIYAITENIYWLMTSCTKKC